MSAPKLTEAQRARLESTAKLGDLQTRIFRNRLFDALERRGLVRWVQANGLTYTVGTDRPVAMPYYKYEVTDAGRVALRSKS